MKSPQKVFFREEFMALITCPECSKSISSQADACPQCGYPMRPSASPRTRNVQQSDSGSGFLKVIFALAVVYFFGGFILHAIRRFLHWGYYALDSGNFIHAFHWPNTFTISLGSGSLFFVLMQILTFALAVLVVVFIVRAVVALLR